MNTQPAALKLVPNAQLIELAPCAGVLTAETLVDAANDPSWSLGLTPLGVLVELHDALVPFDRGLGDGIRALVREACSICAFESVALGGLRALRVGKSKHRVHVLSELELAQALAVYNS